MSTHSIKKSSTVLKALRMLEEIGEYANGISLSEVAAVTELDRSTAYRLLATLVDAGYLVRHEETKKYKLSYKLVSISRLLLATTGPDDLIRETLAHQHTHFHIFRLMFHSRVTEEALEEHEALLDAFAKADSSAAQRAMREHVSRSRGRLLQAFD